MHREFDGIVRQVQQALLQPRRVAAEAGWQRGGLNLDAQLFGLRLVLQHGRDAGGDVGGVDRQVFEFNLAGLDLGQVQDAVDDFQQMAAGDVNLVQALGLTWGDALAPHQVAHAQNGVHRTAYLMAHRRQKAGFGPVGRRGFVTQPDQFSLQRAQLGLGLDAAVDFARQRHGLVGELVVHAHHRVDQHARGARHLLVGQFLGLLQ